MMQVYAVRYDGKRILLPPLTACRLKRTGGVPCDSFEGTFPWDGELEADLADANRLLVEEDGQRRFTGVLDEYELCWDENGGRLTVSGRGLAALLLDNEARGEDYQVATLQSVLNGHVVPYGIRAVKTDKLPAVPWFSVETGSSEWKVLYDFARYHCGVQPRFNVYGDLYVTAQEPQDEIVVDEKTGVTEIKWKDKRYGVYSEMVVLDRGKLAPQRVANQQFIQQGGRCRRVVTMPGKSAYRAMRYSGQFQLDRSYEERLRLELAVPGSYFCEPGQRVRLALGRPKISGTWRVLETETVMDERGSVTRLTLG